MKNPSYYNPPNQMHEAKYTLLDEFVDDLSLHQIEAALIEARMAVLYKKANGTDNVDIRDGFYRKIKELSSRLAEVRKLI